MRHFESIRLKWNARINLVSARDAQNTWTRHIADSLRLMPLIPSGSRIIDLGSGGGFSWPCSRHSVQNRHHVSRV
ncbi:MAG: RsmG family class I SAM-dependent methyltransferase [Acetobacteraceae bacterium]